MPFFCVAQPVSDFSVVYLGGSITDGSDASSRETNSWRALTTAWMRKQLYTFNQNHYNAGVGGTPSWYGLIRLQTDVIDRSPALVFIDFAVNDADSGRGSRTNYFYPSGEALIRRLRAALPNAKLVCNIFSCPQNYSFMVGSRVTARNLWLELASRYNLTLIRWDTYLEGLMGVGYNDVAVEAYLTAAGNVHPNDAGHAAAFATISANMGEVTGNYSGSLPAYYFPTETPDFEQAPHITNGADLVRVGSGWVVSGTAIISSTANDTAAFTGTYCSFGLDCNNAASGVVSYQVDSGSWIDVTLGTTPLFIDNFARGVHTVTIKIKSGTVRINRFLAI